MKKLLILALFLWALPASAQTTINGRVQTGNAAAKPATCSGGDQYNAIDTWQLFICGPANTWVAQGGGGGSINAGTAGDTAYYSAATAISPGTVVLDMAGIAGANLGAKMNACVAQLPSNIGVCIGDNLTGAQTLSTAVTVTAPASVVFTFCGQQISQTAAIAGDGYSIKGCPSKTTIFTKAANIDMMTLSGLYQSISGITLKGNRPTNTGDGIVLNGMEFGIISDVAIQGIKGSSINCQFSAWPSLNDIKVSDFGNHAYLENSCITFINSPTFRDTQDTAPATGTTVDISSSESIYNGGYMTNGSGFAVVNVAVEGSPSTFNGLDIQNFGAFEGMILGQVDLVSNTTIIGGGASHPALTMNSSQVNNSTITYLNGGSDGILVNGAGRIQNSAISFDVTSVTGKCAINLKGESIGANISNNSVASTGTGSGPNYGICVTTVAVQHSLDNFIESNYIDWSDATNSAAVRFDNTAGVSANAANNKFRDTVCIHIHFCVSRVDSLNNRNVYENSQGDPTVTFDSGGSTADIITQNTDSVGITFATLPIAGNGSQIYCTDCTSLTPTTAGGTGAYIFRINNTWGAPGPPSGISFSNNPVNSTAAIGSAVAQNATKLSSFYISTTVSVLSAMAYALSTADNTAAVYDIGIYGPNCRASATGVPLVFHTGPTAGTVLAPSTGVKTIAITGAPVNVNMIPGWYCFANTSSAAAPAAVFAGDSVNTHLAMFTHGAAPAGGTGTTSGGTLNSTITAPATSVIVEPTVFVAGY